MNTFKDETTLNMSANFKTSMKELKVMKKWISELEVETEIRKSFPTKYLLNQASSDNTGRCTSRKNTYFDWMRGWWE